MQGTTYILENHVHTLKYFIQLKYYTVNCLQRACVCVRVCACVCVYVCVCVCACAFVFKIQTIVSCINGQNHPVCMEMPIIIC